MRRLFALLVLVGPLLCAGCGPHNTVETPKDVPSRPTGPPVPSKAPSGDQSNKPSSAAPISP